MTTQAKKLSLFVAAAVGCGIAAVALTGVAQGSRVVGQVEASPADYVGQRIDAAFKAAAESPATRTITIAAARKGDLQATRCAGERWPAISGDCLSGSTRVVARTVTVEYRTGAQSSMLVRMPVELVASR